MRAISVLTISPDNSGKLVIKQIYGQGKEWWEDRLEKYCAVNPDSDVFPQQVLQLLGSKWGAMDYMISPAVGMAAKVVRFWEDHPSMEELLCK